MKRSSKLNMFLSKNLNFPPEHQEIALSGPFRKGGPHENKSIENSTRSKSKALISNCKKKHPCCTQIKSEILTSHQILLCQRKNFKPLRLQSISDRWGNRGWRIVTLQMLSLQYVIWMASIFASLMETVTESDIQDVVRCHSLNFPPGLQLRKAGGQVTACDVQLRCFSWKVFWIEDVIASRLLAPVG